MKSHFLTYDYKKTTTKSKINLKNTQMNKNLYSTLQNVLNISKYEKNPNSQIKM